jgi:hypothetical protein
MTREFSRGTNDGGRRGLAGRGHGGDDLRKNARRISFLSTVVKP